MKAQNLMIIAGMKTQNPVNKELEVLINDLTKNTAKFDIIVMSADPILNLEEEITCVNVFVVGYEPKEVIEQLISNKDINGRINYESMWIVEDVMQSNDPDFFEYYTNNLTYEYDDIYLCTANINL